MNTENAINSAYPYRKKPSDVIIFPKIGKLEATPDSKVFAKGKYNHRSIFKMEGKKQRPRLEERSKDEDWEARTAELTSAHQQDLKNIEQAEKQLLSKIELSKKGDYDIKLSIWEIKNEILQLNTALQEQEAELERLENLFAGEFELVEEQEDNMLEEEMMKQQIREGINQDEHQGEATYNDQSRK